VKVLFVHREPVLASARIRVLDLIPHLRALGIECSAARHPAGPLALGSLLASASAYQAIVLQKKPPSLPGALAWRRRAAPLVFDYDDAILFRQWPRGGSYESATRRRRFARACDLADAFACGNEYLASFCRDAGKPVLIAPSPVQLEVPRTARVRGRPLRVGWIGAPANLPSLATLAPALRELAARRRFVLVVISEAAVSLPGIPTEHVPWSLEQQEQAISQLDVGIMPLEDSPWSRGKCSYKLLQYMAAGVPVVASAVGMNVELVRDGENGLLARDTPSWVAALARLLDPEDDGFARRLGAAGRRTVEEGYGYSFQARRWRDFLAQVADAGRVEGAGSPQRAQEGRQ
jgi:glycosyltransferase involved in cell wall biosynthesis